MIENFLTIPDAPDYEINSAFVVRNKKTGYIRKPSRKNYSKLIYYTLHSPVTPSGFINRTGLALRRQAVAAAHKNTFAPIPSVNGKYEIDIVGNVRNARTKKRIKPNCRDVYSMYIDGKRWVYASRNNLLWEVHGQYKKGSRPVAVWAEHSTGKFFFQSCTDCARFLLDKLYYSPYTLRTYLWARKPAFAGWSFTYVDADPVDVKWRCHSLNALARRQQKAGIPA